MRSVSTSVRMASMVSFYISSLKQLVTLLINHAALIVGNIVIFQQLFTDIEVAALDLALRILDGARSPMGARWLRPPAFSAAP